MTVPENAVMNIGDPLKGTKFLNQQNGCWLYCKECDACSLLVNGRDSLPYPVRWNKSWKSEPVPKVRRLLIEGSATILYVKETADDVFNYS